jgi:hypothetical protein
MRAGDFSVEVVPHGAGRVRELESGHVLARPGQVYRVRLRNGSPLNCVVDLHIDGNVVTSGGLVLEPWSTMELERPVDASEHGRFTVIAEGNEAVFGPDGGRDNPDLGLIEARFRRELPRRDPIFDVPSIVSTMPASTDRPRPVPGRASRVTVGSFLSENLDAYVDSISEPAIERAAGTGLTGHSDQRFVPVHLGPLEAEATIIQLRLVVGSEDALLDAEARPLPRREAPARPAARP